MFLLSIRQRLLSERLTFPVQPVFALTVEQQFVVDVRQQELDAPALYTQFVLHQHNGTAVVSGLWTRNHSDLITEEANLHLFKSGFCHHFEVVEEASGC